MVMLNYRAVYRCLDVDPQNPFSSKFVMPTARATIGDTVPVSEVERLAKEEGRKRGWELVEVKTV